MSLDLPQLRDAVEDVCGCPSRHVQNLWVTQGAGGHARFEGDVHVFALDHHPTAASAYVWSDDVAEPARVFVVLRTDQTLTAKDAVGFALDAQRTTMN
jgi:hypothetical protein